MPIQSISIFVGLIKVLKLRSDVLLILYKQHLNFDVGFVFCVHLLRRSPDFGWRDYLGTGQLVHLII